MPINHPVYYEINESITCSFDTETLIATKVNMFFLTFAVGYVKIRNIYNLKRKKNYDD